MVYSGKPSRGCAVCRRRRIKCDEKPGSCSYCIKTNQECPGYKDDFELAWRDQTATARNQVKRRKKAQEQASSEGALATVRKINSDNVSTSKRNDISILLSPQEFPQDHAVPFLCHNHIFVRRDYDSSTGFMETIPVLYANSRPGTPIWFAVNMIGMRMLEPWIDTTREYTKSRALYGKTLAAARDQVASGRDCWSDEFLLAILLLDMYEDLLTQKRGDKVETHITAAEELVRRRPAETYQSDLSKALLLSVRTNIVSIVLFFLFSFLL